MARSLNEVKLIGNLTRDPELRYTPQGTAVATFGIATNRSWTTEDGEKKEETEFHRIVAWNKLAELCSQLLAKGRKVYVSGRLANRSWTGQDGAQRSITEVVIDNMIILDSRRDFDKEGEAAGGHEVRDDKVEPKTSTVKTTETKKEEEKKETSSQEIENSDVNPDDIPF